MCDQKRLSSVSFAWICVLFTTKYLIPFKNQQRRRLRQYLVQSLCPVMWMGCIRHCLLWIQTHGPLYYNWTSWREGGSGGGHHRREIETELAPLCVGGWDWSNSVSSQQECICPKGNRRLVQSWPTHRNTQCLDPSFHGSESCQTNKPSL